MSFEQVPNGDCMRSRLVLLLEIKKARPRLDCL